MLPEDSIELAKEIFLSPDLMSIAEKYEVSIHDVIFAIGRMRDMKIRIEYAPGDFKNIYGAEGY